MVHFTRIQADFANSFLIINSVVLTQREQLNRVSIHALLENFFYFC